MIYTAHTCKQHITSLSWLLVESDTAPLSRPLFSTSSSECVKACQMADARLLNAAFNKDCKALRSYIKKGYDCKSSQREAPYCGLFHVVAGLSCVDCDKGSIIQSLIKAGADINARDDTGLTPLMVCVNLRHSNSAEKCCCV
jgi:hypothetical protein